MSPSTAFRRRYSPDRVNFLVPVTVKPGAATIVVRTSSGHYSIGTAQIVKSAPTIFDVEAEGNAVSFSTGNGANLQFPWFKLPVNNRPNILTLYGTGIRNIQPHNPRIGNGVAESVSVTIDGQPARVIYAGRQGRLSGLDQVIVEIPPGLNGPVQRQAEVAISINGVAVSRAMRLVK
ncbi:MAG: hypothetical protein J2P31_07340 [Blastocatellia bacterium]|nr:hypothetical protein [Blastocatellia bacterium]